MLSGNQAVLARAVVGLPGLSVDRRFGAFLTKPTRVRAN